MRKPGRWIYILSFLPGLGHFYLGLMNRGLQLMLLFFGGILFSEQAFEELQLLLPVIVFYSYFDALRNYNSLLETGERNDELLFEWGVFKGKEFVIGWGLVLLGVFSVLSLSQNLIATYVSSYIPHQFLERVVLAIIFIAGGIKLLRGEKKKEAA
ncbi:MAG: hypothetical protein K0S34_1278 [Bacillales bacterium]|jgi:hypothetical protein|nr:hypothetical protein [Bacillales bacterium]